MLAACRRLETLNLRGNPICSRPDWNTDVHPLPAKGSDKWALFGMIPHIKQINGMTLKGPHIAQVVAALNVGDAWVAMMVVLSCESLLLVARVLSPVPLPMLLFDVLLGVRLLSLMRPGVA